MDSQPTANFRLTKRLLLQRILVSLLLVVFAASLLVCCAQPTPTVLPSLPLPPNVETGALMGQPLSPPQKVVLWLPMLWCEQWSLTVSYSYRDSRYGSLYD